MEVVTFVGYRPPPRYDGTAWTQAQIYEASTEGGTYTTLEVLPLAPLDSDPAQPVARSFTTELGTALDYWYRIVFVDATGDTSVPTTPVQNVAGGYVPVVSRYVDTSELARVLNLTAPTAAQTVALERAIESASAEIDAYLTPSSPYLYPYPALVTQVCLERAVEHWKQEQSPFGLVNMGGDSLPAFTSRNSWRRHAQTLLPLKVSWGLADIASDDFNRANSANLGANWEQVTSIGTFGRMTLSSNAAKVNTVSAEAWVTPFDADQFSQVTLGTLDASGAHIWLLLNLADPAMTSFTGYLLDMIQGGGGVCSLTLYRGDNGSYTTLIPLTAGIAYASGDVWSVEKDGADLTVKRNGLTVSGFDAFTDPAPLTGSSYAGIGGSNSTSATVDDWEGGELELGPPAEVAGTGLIGIAEAMAAALAPVKAAIPELQVHPFLNPNPTPPSIDIYPADLFQTGSGFRDDMDTFWTVRARTTTADHAAGQRALLRMLDRAALESVEAALTSDQTLGGIVQAVAVTEEGVSGYRVYAEDPQSNGSLIGCEWRVEVITQ